jgi:hypothetical protein
MGADFLHPLVRGCKPHTLVFLLGPAKLFENF